MVTWPTSAAAKPGAVAELMFQSGQTPWYKVLELNVATASGMNMVCTFPVRVICKARSDPSTCLALQKGCTDLGRTRCTMRRMGGACGMARGGCKALEEMRFRSPS